MNEEKKVSEKKKLVKTGKEIIDESITTGDCRSSITYSDSVFRDKYLILPEGLDALEKMLTEEIITWRIEHYDLSPVFARFKKENGL